MAGHVRKMRDKWVARWPMGERGKFKSKSFARKLDAERWLVRMAESRENPSWVDPHGGKVAFADVAGEWMARRNHLAASTVARDRSYLDSIILPAFGGMPIGRITTDDLERWVAKLDLAPATVVKAHQITSAILKRAVREQLIARNPAELTENLPRIEHLEMMVITRPQAELLAEACNGYGRLVVTAAWTGLRWAELVGLEHDAVNREAKTLTVSRTIVETNGQLIRKAPKTKGSRRTISVPQRVLDAIGEGDGLVFTDSDGGALRRSNFRPRVWEPATATVGLTGLRFHDLRHTHASWLIEQGVHPKVISTRLGHSSIKVTMDRYGHLMDGLDKSVGDLLDGL